MLAALMAKLAFRKLDDHCPLFWGLIALHVALLALGGGAALYIEEHGHIVTGMSNQVVWGTPHVVAVFLIVAASGVLNVASTSSVFNWLAYKPYARLSGILAVFPARRRPDGSRARPRMAHSRLHGDDAQQLQVDLRLEHLPLHQLRRHRRGISKRVATYHNRIREDLGCGIGVYYTNV
jgi:hypothetical protein